jgi:hypothetical protein
MNDIAAVAIQKTAKIIKGPTNIQIRYVYMPMLMRSKRLYKPITLTGGFTIPPQQKPRTFENPVHTTGTHRYDVGIHQHIGEAAVTILGVVNGILHDGLFFPRLQPKISRNPAIMLVYLTVAFTPLVIFAPAYAD